MDRKDREIVIKKIISIAEKVYENLTRLLFIIQTRKYLPDIIAPPFSFENTAGEEWELTGDSTARNLRKWARPYMRCKGEEKRYPFFELSDGVIIPRILLGKSTWGVSMETLIEDGFHPKDAYNLILFLNQINSWVEETLEKLKEKQAEIEEENKKYYTPIIAEEMMGKLEEI